MVDLISQILNKVLQAEKELSEAIASGSNVHSFDAYQRLVGKRDGLLEAISVINETLSEDDEAV